MPASRLSHNANPIVVIDSLVRRTTHTDFSGQTHQYHYDETTGRLTGIDYADGSQHRFEYDIVGNRTRATHLESDGTEYTSTWQYDAQNRPIREEQPSGAVLEHEYDLAGNRTRLIVTAPDGTLSQDTEYRYDAIGRLTQVNDGHGWTQYTYDRASNPTRVTHSNQSRQDYQYDDLNRLTALDIRRGSSIQQSLEYTLDDTGRRTQLTAQDPAGQGTVTDWAYDDLGRLTQETIADAQTLATLHSASYTHDAVGNRLSQTQNGQLTSYQYNANDWLTEHTGPDGTTSYSFDANGNTLTEVGPNGTTEYQYNSRNRIAGVTRNGQNTKYVYNTDGIRIQKTDNGLTTDYTVDNTWSHPQVVLETTQNQHTHYTHGLNRIRQTRNGQTHHYHHDALGSTRALSGPDGFISDTWDYTAFGETHHRTGDTDNHFLFTGEAFDASLNHYYLRARYYNPGTGRFPTMDTYRGRNHEPATLHKYLYTHGDPINMVDPSGHESMSSLSAGSRGSAILSRASLPVVRTQARGFAANDARYSAAASASYGSAVVTRVGKTLLLAFGTSSIASSSFEVLEREALPESRAELESAVNERTRGRKVVYHYSDRAAILDIYGTGMMQWSARYKGRLGGGVTFPQGAYATDIPPWWPGLTQRGMSALFYGGNEGKDVGWFVAIDNSFGEFHSIFGAANQLVKDCPAGDYVSVHPLIFGPSLLDP